MLIEKREKVKRGKKMRLMDKVQADEKVPEEEGRRPF